MHSSTSTARLPPAELELIGLGMGPDPGLPTLVSQTCCENNLNSNNLHSDVSSPLEKETLSHLTLININKKNTVVNLSSRNLSSDEESLLSKGLNFCPTPGEPRFTTAISPSVVFRPQTSTKAPLASAHFETFATLNEIQLNHSRLMNPKKQNLRVQERASIKSLRLDTTITIKPADKGGAVVVMDTCDYIKEAERQLSDVKYYKRVSTDLTAEHTARINTYLEGLTLKGEINNKVKHKLITTSSQTPHRVRLLISTYSPKSTRESLHLQAAPLYLLTAVPRRKYQL